MMGCSNPHPHGQVWSLSAIPTIPAQELRSLKEYAMSTTNNSTASIGTAGKSMYFLGFLINMGRQGSLVSFANIHKQR